MMISDSIPKRILVVDDEPDLRELVMYNLTTEGFSVTGAAKGSDALHLIEKGDIDLVVLDLMLPGINGFDVCRRIRENPATSGIPVLMLTAKSDDTDKILGLELGADDYLTKPFNPRELIARVRAILRRSSRSDQHTTSVVTAGNLSILTDEVRVLKHGTPVELSPTEYKLLLFLIERAGKVYTRDQLLDFVWRGDAFVEPRTVDVHIRRLRQKIEDDPANPSYIMTRRGAGYFFQVPG